MKESKKEKIISRNFGGKSLQELIPKECGHRKLREESYLSLALQVKNKKSILESLDEYIQGEIVEGYLCDICNKKYPTTKRLVIKQLPNTLILVLKRF